MKKLILLLIVMILKPATAEVGNADLSEIRKLITDGKYEEALQKHLWFHEESKKSAGMGGVRLSYALSQWKDLGSKYPKALDAFKGIRDRHEKTLLAGQSGFSAFHEYAAFNDKLKEDDKTYKLFKTLHTKYPSTASDCFRVAMDLVIEHKDYELCAAYMKDPIKLYEDARHMRELHLSMAKTNPKMNNPAFTQYADESFITKTCQLIEVMVNIKKTDEAKEIQKRALGYFPDQRIKDAIP